MRRPCTKCGETDPGKFWKANSRCIECVRLAKSHHIACDGCGVTFSALSKKTRFCPACAPLQNSFAQVDDPTPEEIEARKKEIQATWGPRERAARLVYRPVSYSIPEAALPRVQLG